MPLVWRILIGIGGVLLLALVAVAIAINTLDAKSFIGPIQKRVMDATGRELKINGGVSFKLSLTPRIVIEDASLGNAPWGNARQMVAVKRVELQMALLPLLRRDFQVSSLTLVEPVIALETDSKGTGNWEFAKSAPGTSAAATPSEAATSGGLFVGEASIVSGKLSYRDGTTGKLTAADIVELALKTRDPQSAVSARFRGNVGDVAVALDGSLGPLDTLAKRRWPYPIMLKGALAGQPVAVDAKLSMDGTTLRLEPLDLGFGKSKVNGQVSIATGKARANYSFKLTATTLALADVAKLGAGPPGKPGAMAAAGAKSRYVFSDNPIDLSAFRSADVTGELAADALLLTDGSKLDNVHVQFSLQNGLLDAPMVRGGILGGTLLGRAKLDTAGDRNGAIDLHVEAKGLDLSAILAEADIKRDVRGGKTSLNADIMARGTSLHQWAASASGNVLLTVGPAALGHGSDNGDAAFNRLADAVNPFRKVDSSTELQCAVIRLPLAGGIAKVDRSIGIETNKIGANASGTLDFRNETLDLSIKPQIRKGITLNIDRIASLVRFHGPFTAPIVGVDAMASAATVATIGAAVTTGGISLLGQSLLSSVVADPGAPCQIALGRGGSPSSDAGATAPSRTPAQELGNAFGKLFKR